MIADAERARRKAAPNWMRPQVEQPGLRTYIEILRERRWVVVLAVALTVGAAVLYLSTADKVYEAEADLLVAPVPSDDALLVSLGLIRQSSDPTRDVETAARLASSREVAELVRDDLALQTSPEALLNDVTAEPVAQSNVVAIAAEAGSPEEAAELANAFAEAFVADRSEALRARIAEILPTLTERLGSEESGIGLGESLRSDVSRLEFLRTAGDPTIQVETPAAPPDAPASPRPMLTLGAALIAGLVLGLGGAFAAQVLDPRLRREEQLRRRFSLPILTRVPREATARKTATALAPGNVSPPTMEAYRTLRASVSASQRGPSGTRQSILVTGSAPFEGKTTTAINLAASFALGGKSVILIEADLRRPAIGRALGIEVRKGVASTLLGTATLDEALVTSTPFGPNLKLLLADFQGSWMSEMFSLPAAERLLDEAKAAADYVIFDSPPLTAVVDTLPLARQVDDVLIVSRLGVTRLDRLQELAELLASNEIVPVGFALVGTAKPRSNQYYYYEPSSPTASGPREAPQPIRSP